MSTLIINVYDVQRGIVTRRYENVNFETMDFSHGILQFEQGDLVRNFCSTEPFDFYFEHEV